MAILTRLRAHKPLANSPVFSSWHGTENAGEYYNLRVTDGHSYCLALRPIETFSFIEFVAGRLTHEYGPVMGWTDKRTFAEKLRAMADKIEKGQ